MPAVNLHNKAVNRTPVSFAALRGAFSGGAGYRCRSAAGI